MEPARQQPKSLYPPNSEGRCPASAPSSALLRSQATAKTYHGRHGRNGCAEVWVEEVHPQARRRREATTIRPLPLHLEVRAHSPTGFAWGYSGSGPAQLALALMLDATGNEELALTHYQELKRKCVADWKDAWSITAQEIQAFVEAEEQRTVLERNSFAQT